MDTVNEKHDVAVVDEEDRQGRINFADDIEAKPRRARQSRIRRDSGDTMSIRSMSRRRSVEPNLVLPPQFRTL